MSKYPAPPFYKDGCFWLGVLLTLFMLLFVLPAHAASPAIGCLADAKDWTGVRIWRLGDTKWNTVRDFSELESLETIEGDSIWRGYPEGFDFPRESTYLVGVLQIAVGKPPDNTVQQVEFYWSPDTPDAAYLLAYDTLAVFADANSEHTGQHPCMASVAAKSELPKALALPLAQVDAVFDPDYLEAARFKFIE